MKTTITLISIAFIFQACAFRTKERTQTDSPAPAQAQQKPTAVHTATAEIADGVQAQFTVVQNGSYAKLDRPVVVASQPLPESLKMGIVVDSSLASSSAIARVNGLTVKNKPVAVHITNSTTAGDGILQEFEILNFKNIGLEDSWDRSVRLIIDFKTYTLEIELRTPPAPVTVSARTVQDEKTVFTNDGTGLKKVGIISVMFANAGKTIRLPAHANADLVTAFTRHHFASNFNGQSAGNVDWNNNPHSACTVTDHPEMLARRTPSTFLIAPVNADLDQLSMLNASDESTMNGVTSTNKSRFAELAIYKVSTIEAFELTRSGACAEHGSISLVNSCYRTVCDGANNTGRCEGGTWRVTDDGRGDYREWTEVSGIGFNLNAIQALIKSSYADTPAGREQTNGSLTMATDLSFVLMGSVDTNAADSEIPETCELR